jgi:anti-sigma B factor antagonist
VRAINFSGADTMPATRHLDIDERGDVTIIRFRDERVTDPMEIEDLGRQMYNVLEYKNCDKVVIDFTPVEFLSSATIGKLISLNRKAKQCKTAVRLCGMQQGVRDIFHMCSLDRVFEIREDAKTALASF